jgi:hypothetical protein
MLTATDPILRTAIRAAADAEQLPVLDGAEGERFADHTGGVVVVDHDVDRGVMDVLRSAVRGSASRLAVLALTRGRPPADNTDDVAIDWLVWPASMGHIRTKLRAAVLRRACRWQSAPLPPDEDRRVESLHSLGLLDTAPEERFDRLTRQACEMFDVPVALVTLVDSERQWFKSKQGIAGDETDRDQSVCAHAILEPSMLHVPDMLEDDRFADNPAVSGPGMRFYAGVPLVLSDGSRVGTFCVADQRPRALDDPQKEQLRELARQAESELTNTPAAATG